MYHQGALEGRCKGADKQDDPRSDLAVPSFVAEPWQKGTKEKEELAELLLHLNYDKASRSWNK